MTDTFNILCEDCETILGTWKPNDDQEVTEVLIIEKCKKGYLCELCAQARAEREVQDDGA